MLTTTMGKHGVEKQQDKMQSQATSAMGVEIAASDECRTNSSLANKRTNRAELIGINAEDIDNSKLVSAVSVEEIESESITCNGDGKPTAVATPKLVPYNWVVSLGERFVTQVEW
jgi:hypothetical protein